MAPAPMLWGIPLKWVSLVLMVVHMVGMVLILRVSRTQHVEGPRYLSSTAILFSEIGKFIFSTVLHWFTTRRAGTFSSDIAKHFVTERVELLKTAVPSLLYTAQNNLLFIGLSHLTAGTYQVTYQLKILVTAGLSVVILGTKLSHEKWGSLVVLTAGVALVNRRALDGSKPDGHGDSIIGIGAVLAACFTSGLAGVYLEKILKQTTASLFIRNMQLASFASGFALCIALKTDGEAIRQHGFLQGYSPLVWGVIVCQAIGGLLVAAVMRYADNILKCFGCAIGIIFTCIISVLQLNEFAVDGSFLAGTSLVLSATAVYSLGLPRMDLLQLPRRLLGLKRLPSSEQIEKCDLDV
eukprot:TRINITY_DN27362_c0_g1_i1.p1 TRINITY_DN27362_c0_g1~~TRINITY_DN27362_c0_g1_i1.p1  ORF type:complete len:352 (+),score=30.78 TRINITY_DN27362_c0_g1_i1:99-1154(+)